MKSVNEIQFSLNSILTKDLTAFNRMIKLSSLNPVEIYNLLKEQDLEVFAFDPFANANEVLEKHQIKLIHELTTYDAIVLTVAHDFFKSLNYASLKKSTDTVIYDTKAFLDKSIITARL